MPSDVLNYITSFIPEDDLMRINFLNISCRKVYFDSLQNETDKKIGLYGKNLILEGLALYENPILKELEIAKSILKIEWEQSSTVNNEWIYAVQTLFMNALCHPEGKSRKTLVALSFTSHSASEAIANLNSLTLIQKKQQENTAAIDKQLKLLDFQLEQLRGMRKTEKVIYNISGGKDQFHKLTILHLEGLAHWKGVDSGRRYKDLTYYNDKWYSSGEDYSVEFCKIKKLPIGESVVRGIDPLNRPFIAISIRDPFTSYDVACKNSEVSFTRLCQMLCSSDLEKPNEVIKFIDNQDRNRITILYQRFSDDASRWGNSSESYCSPGLFKDNLSRKGRDGLVIGSNKEFIISGPEKIEYVLEGEKINFFPTIKQLLTKGSCFIDSESEEDGRIELINQGEFDPAILADKFPWLNHKYWNEKRKNS